jgi:hypothetical protein
VTYPTAVVKSLQFHVYLCVMFLNQRREVIDQIHSLGCNLELCVHAPEFREPFTLSANTMKVMAELRLQFSLIPTAAADQASLGGSEVDPGVPEAR